jgi:rubrerythrin
LPADGGADLMRPGISATLGGGRQNAGSVIILKITSQKEPTMNVFDFAVKMEVDGKAFYEKLAQQSSMAGLKTIFSRLAEDEQKHLEVFQNLQGRSQTMAMAATTVLDDAKNIFADLVASERPAIPKADLEAYRYAMKLEAESFRLYEEAAAKEKNADVKNLLQRIAAEEHKHFSVLENIYDFVNAPHQYLAWGEFSNMDEFRNFGREVDL